MLTRRIEKDICNWIECGNKALLVDGARQVGKTYIIKRCLENKKVDYVEFNLVKMPKIVPLLQSFESVEELITNLSLFTSKKIVRGKTFIFFDEIQEAKDIVTKIKFLVEEGSFRYVLSGSLLGVELRGISSAPVGYLKTLTMYPLDFEEFLQLYNFTDELKEKLYECFLNVTPVDEVVHSRMMDIFNLYLIVGGMPAAVNKFKQTSNLEDVVDEHNAISVQYKNDFTKYESEQKKPHLTHIYDLIAPELNSPNKRFNFVDIQKGLRYERSEDDFLWLVNAGVALPAYNITEPKVPLVLNSKSSLFKLFLLDVGMLTTTFGKATKLKILSKEKGINNGALYENVVAQELKAHGFETYYYSNKKMGELDFVVEYNGEVLPIEVKSGKDYQVHSALSNVLKCTEYKIDRGIVFNNYNVSKKGNIVYYPVYMVMFLKNDDVELPEVDYKKLSF
jgi:hypothetical protein